MAQQNDHQSPEQIEQQLAQTREHMQETLAALESRLDGGRLKSEATEVVRAKTSEAKEAIRAKTIGRVEEMADDAARNVKGASADVFDTIRHNPVPAALAAIGLGWLFMEVRNGNQDRDRYQGRYFNERDYRTGYRGTGRSRYDYDRGYEGEAGRTFYREDQTMGHYGEPGQRTGSGMRNVAGQAQERVGHMTDQVQDKASQVAGTVQDKAGQVADQVQETAGQMADQVQETAGQVADQVQYRAGQAANWLQTTMDEKPLLIGAGALALGVAVGLSLPSTQKENEMLGPARDQFMDKAQETASDTLDKVRQVAEKAGDAAKDAAKDEAQKQNLTASS